jgi:hypothetical protein
MPLFLTPEVDVSVPLEATYQAALEGIPADWRDVLSNAEEVTEATCLRPGWMDSRGPARGA